jgi:bifunctional DNA-binding transcriptional regulator/antitoxin component of YhaV-PrlF toxin-antitoxin module
MIQVGTKVRHRVDGAEGYVISIERAGDSEIAREMGIAPAERLIWVRWDNTGGEGDTESEEYLEVIE